MSNTIIELRHSYVTGNVPSSLANGEIAINTYDGKLFYRGGPSNTVQTIERYSGPAGLDTEIQFNDSGVLGSSANLTFNKLTGLFRAGNVTANTVTTRDYIQFGDGTRQYTANAGSGSGSGTTINVYNANTQVFTETANGTGTTFNLGFVPASQNNIIVSSNGVVQYDYTLSSSTLIFNFTPPAGALIRVQTFGTSQANSLSGVFANGNLIIYDGNTLVSLANTNTAGTYGNSTHVPVITTDAYGRVLSVTNTSISGLGASDQYARDTANAAFGTANSAGSYANAAFIHANSAFNAANTADAKAVTAGSYANSAFIVANSAAIAANTPSHVANSAAIYANGAFAKANTQDAINLTQNNSITAAFIRANNSLDANNGGTVTGTITATSFITTGSYGNIQGANIIYANTFVANTGFIQFADGSKQYTANAGSDQYARNTANAAFETANNEAGVNLTQNTTIEAAFSQANGAFALANNESGVNATQNNSITASFEAANSAGVYANGAFNRANNSINANTGGSITGDLFISGNLTVTGLTTYTNTSTLLVNDNIITVNNGISQSGEPLVNAGLEVNRGAQPNSSILWIETSGKWAANNGNTQYFLGSDAAEAYANAAFLVANTADDKATSAGIYANGAFQAANSAGVYANSAYVHANAGFVIANDAFFFANVGIQDANTAHNKANAAFIAANNQAGVNLTQNTNIQFAWNHANAAFLQANTGGSGVKIDVYNANTNVFTDTANGTGTTFSLGFTPNSANNIIVSANGVVQYDYSLAGSTLILNFTPTIGTLIRVQSFGSSQANSLNGIFQTGNLIVYDGNTLVSLANTNTPGTFGNSTHIPVITTDSYGRITGVVNTTIGISGEDQYARNTANAAFNAANTKVSKSGDTMTGNLTFSFGGALLGNVNQNEIALTSNVINDLSGFIAYGLGSSVVYANTSVQLVANTGGGGSTSIWNFNPNGSLEFPDSTIQTTAYVPGDEIDPYARNHANAAFDSANTKTYTYVQSVVPATANVAGALWQNTSSGIVYMNFGNTSNPIWAEL
jgi:hypothetical protein